MKICIIYLLTVFFEIIQCRIRFVLEIFRHGARSPMNTGIDYFNFTWSGASELTSSGMRQHFLIGHRNRRRYVDQEKLLSPEFNPKEIYIASTDTNRTIMSAHSQLFGLYPPGSGHNLRVNQLKNAVPPMPIDDLDKVLNTLGNSALIMNSQIFPVHIFSTEDHFINFQDKCVQIVKRQQENKNKQIVKKFLDSFNQNFGVKLNQIYDKNIFDFSKYETVYSFMDNFICSYFDKREFPNLQKIVNLDQLYTQAIEFLRLDMFEVNYGDQEGYSARVTMSAIIRKLYYYFDNIISFDHSNLSKLDDPKFVMYSAHDTNIVQMLITINQGLKLNIPYDFPVFASSLIFEFSNDHITSYNIEIFYNGISLYKDKYTNFQIKINSVLISSNDINSFCAFTKESSINSYFIIAIIILGIFSIILMIALTIFYIKNKKLIEYQNISIQSQNL